VHAKLPCLLEFESFGFLPSDCFAVSLILSPKTGRNGGKIVEMFNDSDIWSLSHCKVLSWVKILVCNKESERICADGPFSVHVWVSRTSGLLFKTRETVSRCKKKKTVIWSQERHCTLYILWVLESLFIQAARGYKRWVLYFYRSIKGDRTKREGSRYVWSHQSSSRKDHALFHPKHQMVRDRFKLQWGWAPVALDPKHLH
jgi:hypothetical protein